MSTRLCFIALLLLPTFILATDTKQKPTTVGGSGSYKTGTVCMDTGKKDIAQICANLTIHYKLSALMGEPMVHYGMSWELDSIVLKGGKELSAQMARKEFGDSIDKIAIMISAVAEVNNKKHTIGTYIGKNEDLVGKMGNPSSLIIDVDSGVATRAGKISWNIAGSPDWKQFLMFPRSGECMEGAIYDKNLLGAGVRQFTKAQTAKAIMKEGGLELSHRAICKKGTLVEGLDFAPKPSEGIYVDSAANFMWQDDESAKTVKLIWQDAMNYCENLNLAGYDDWRLPNVDELKSLFIKKLNLKNISEKSYWSGSLHNELSQASYVYFRNGNSGWSYKDDRYLVRCIRENK